MDAVLKIVQTVNMYLSDYILIIMLIGCGLYFSFKTKFVQVRCFGEGWRKVFGNFSLHGGKHEGGMSSFQALATAIAAQVGTGNIVGACGAILVGGPGAIFWMWIIAFCGPVYYIKKAFNNGFGKFMAGFFAVAIILALGFMGAMVQSNSIGESCQNAFGIPSWVMGAIIAVICAFIFIGGAHRVAAVAEKLVSIMAILYVLGGLVVIICRIQYVPETFALIFKCAFNPTAVIGGSIGFAIKQAISQGVKRGLFSNEAGMGSTPHAHAQAKVKCPHEQGVVAMIGVFIDTFVVLTMTALVVISTLYTGDGILSGVMTSSENLDALGVAKTNLAQLAFGSVFGESFGSAFVAICLLFFAFTTIIGWNLFGRINIEYLFGKKAVLPYSIIAIAFIFLGSLLSNDLVWELTDMFNQLMVIPNVIALLALGGLVAASAKAGNSETLENVKK